MKKINILFYIFSALMFAGCDDFLNEPATKTGVLPEKVSDLGNFYNSYFKKDPNEYRTLISDDVEFPFDEQDIKDNVGTFQKRIFEFRSVYFRRDLRRDNQRGGSRLWSSSYGNINTQNYVLSMINDQTLEGTTEEREQAKAQAYIRRAMSLFDLVTSFCMPYSPGENDDALGVVLRENYNIDMNAQNLSRSTLKESYDFIENDILNSLKTIREGSETFRLTKKAVYAFAARFYLMVGNYTEAKKYAELALTKNSTLVDYTTFKTIEVTERGKTLNVIPYFYEKTTINEGTIKSIPEIYYVETLEILGKPYFPSKNLVNLYLNDAGNKDVRFWNMNIDAGVARSRYVSLTSQKQFRYYTGYTYSGDVLSAPDVPEMILIKAECLAEDNQLDNAKAELNKLRSKRIINYDPTSVNKLSTKDAVLDFIYSERRREKPFYLRGMDIRRLNAIKHKNIVVEKQFFDMTPTEVLSNKPRVYRLQPDDKRYADYLFDGDITLSEGLLEQNP